MQTCNLHGDVRLPRDCDHVHATHCGTCAARSTGLCEALSNFDLKHLADTAHWCSLAKGRILIEEGDPRRYIFNISNGHAKLYKDLPDGRRQIIGFVSAGALIGFGTDAPYSFTAEALDEVHLCRFDRQKLADLFAKFPVLEKRILSATCDSLVSAQAHMLLLGRKTALERLASFLLAWAGPSIAGGASQRLFLPMGRGDIADYLGLTIETISRNMTVLRKKRLIFVVADQEIEIIDHAALRAVGTGDAKTWRTGTEVAGQIRAVG